MAQAECQQEGDAITEYSWTDAKRTVSVSVELEGLHAVADELLSVAYDVRSCSLAIAAIGTPPRRRVLRLAGLSKEIEGAKLERTPGQNVAVLRLSKKTKKPWKQLLDASGEPDQGVGQGVVGEEDHASPTDEAMPSHDEDPVKAFMKSKDNTFFYAVRGWEETSVPEVDKLLAVTRELREAFIPVDNWDEVGAVSLHKAIATRLLGRLRSAKRVLDIGCGTGALLAVFAELAPRAKLEGLESEGRVAKVAPTRLIMAAELFKKKGKEETERAARVASQGIGHGDGFEFNGDGSAGGLYDVLSVGFAMLDKDVPVGLWHALADGGQLCVPVCDEPVQTAFGKYQAHLHFFTKRPGGAFPGLSAPLGPEHAVLEQPVHFELIRPDKEAQRREIKRRLQASGWAPRAT